MSIIDNALQVLFNWSRRTLVWENASPTSAFLAQKINVDLSDAPRIAVRFKYANNSDTTWEEEFVNSKRSSVTWHASTLVDKSYVSHVARSLTPDSTGVDFTDAGVKATNTNGLTTNNARIIPIAIFKLGRGNS